jgi:hypothetical protein
LAQTNIGAQRKPRFEDLSNARTCRRHSGITILTCGQWLPRSGILLVQAVSVGKLAAAYETAEASRPLWRWEFSGLASVRVPVLLWQAGDDRHQPGPWYEEHIRDALPGVPE